MPLFSFGSNSSGQLGIGHVEDVSLPMRCLFSSSEDDILKQEGGEITRIAAGGNHTLVLFKSGAVYTAGYNVDGRCGVVPGPASEPREKVVSEPEASSLLQFEKVTFSDPRGRKVDRFKDVSATWDATFLVSCSDDEEQKEQEEVFVMGSGMRGELGLGETCTRASAPVKIPDFPPPGTKVGAIASSVGHTVAVLSNGDVYGWGGARKGQLGESVKDRKIVWSPVKIEGIPFRATGAACGREFTIIAGNKEREFRILGSADSKWRVLADAPAALGSYSLVAASWHGIYVHQSDMSVRAWGRNDRGQLPPPDLPKPKKIAVGSEHVLALLDDERTVVAFGWGEHGNCGPETDAQGNVKGRWNVIPLELSDNSKVVGIGAGCATSWIVVS
ncbi:hypothetical protein VTN00DRAFT_173 [Thermoascus crustaceus]|uniref:uncharacterized protein n=1 Tax=Thermoascus crustaceus TaxID=5088 RepID=UPI0037448B1E